MYYSKICVQGKPAEELMVRMPKCPASFTLAPIIYCNVELLWSRQHTVT